MKRKKRHASLPIESDESQDISESQKKHYTRLGYKPYLSYRGKVKWLSDEQHIYEKIKYAHKRHNYRTKRVHHGRHRKRSIYKNLIRTLKKHWLILLIVFAVILLLIFNQEVIGVLS